MSVRKDTKENILLNPPIKDELAYATDTNEMVYINPWTEELMFDNLGNEIPSNGIELEVLTKDAGLDNKFIWKSIDHDELVNYVDNEHIDWTVDQGDLNIHQSNYTVIDWTVDQGASNIHPSNYIDTNTTELVLDTTPQLGGDLNCDNNIINNSNMIYYNGLYDNGNLLSSNNELIPNNGKYQKGTLTGNCTLNITTPTGPCVVYLHLYQGADNLTLTLPVGEWIDGIIKSNTLTIGAHDLIEMHYTGSGWVFDMKLNLS